MTSIHCISGVIQPYAWGGYYFIADLLNLPADPTQPKAELWMGAHPKGPARVLMPSNGHTPLDKWIENAPVDILGQRVASQFHGQLPFLFKVLDVRKMLSIQCHPNKEVAERGFAREEAAGIPRLAPERIYRDANHKPELMVALTDFYLLHGFTHREAIADRFAKRKEWSGLINLLDQGIRPLYEHLMHLPQGQINQLLTPLREELLKKEATEAPKTDPNYWARQAFLDYSQPNGDLDRGIFSIYLMNIVHLKPGEGIFQDAGILHAYLEGVNIEIMANSDNVFRGGLTPKHIAVEELLAHTFTEPIQPEILSGQWSSPNEKVYPTPAADFLLSEVRLTPAHPTFTFQEDSPAILLILQGKIDLKATGQRHARGTQLFIPAGAKLHGQLAEDQISAVAYLARVPNKK